MATVLLAAGNTALISADFVVAAGDTVGLIPVPATGAAGGMAADAFVYLEIKDAANNYQPAGGLSLSQGTRGLSVPGTYRLVRPAQANQIGVDRG